MIEFWENYIDTISKTRINYSNYKCEDVITSLPLYSVDVIEEYEEYIKYVDQNFDYFERVIKQSRFVENVINQFKKSIKYIMKTPITDIFTKEIIGFQELKLTQK